MRRIASRQNPIVARYRLAAHGAADVLLGMSCYFMRAFKMLDHDAVLYAYADRCAARPAFQKALSFEN